VKKLIFILTVCISLNLIHFEARANDEIALDDFYCGSGPDFGKNQVQIGVPESFLGTLGKAGPTSVIGKIVVNGGSSFTNFTKRIPNGSDTFLRLIWTNIPSKAYTCYVATTDENGLQGPWLLVGGTCLPGFQFGPRYSPIGLEVVDERTKCRPVQWDYEDFDDGFDNYVSISMDKDGENSSTLYEADVQIFCEKKKIFVYVWVPYAQSSGWTGSAQVRFDSSNPKKVSSWLQRNFNGIYLKDSKSFMAQLAKTKSKFGFKIPTVRGSETVSYFNGNILEYRPIFKKAGCSF